MKSVLITLIAFVLFVSCHSLRLPSKKYTQYKIEKSYSNVYNTLTIKLGNPLKCPLRVWIQTSDEELKIRFNKINPILLNSETDTIITFDTNIKPESKITFASLLGNVAKAIKPLKLELPFLKGRQYKVIQGNNTNYTHNTNYSRYAVDFNLKKNDTICSATSGFVVGVIDKYKYGGKGNEWEPYGNFITIYEPNSGIFTQYVHLTENGSLVKIGDRIKKGQAIGLSGMTGQTDVEHLHFNCLIPINSEDGLISIPFEFVGGYKSTELKKEDLIEK